MTRDTEITADDQKRIEPASRSQTGSRARKIFSDNLQRIHISTDRTFASLLVFQWLAGIVAAIFISPVTWAGAAHSVHMHVMAAIVYGGLLTALPLYLIKFRPGATITRHVIAVCQTLFSDLFIQISGGRIETHFHVFGSLALLAFYRDPAVLLSASSVVAITHGIRGIYWPESVYGVVHPEPWRFLEHVFWVSFEDAWLIVSIRQSLKEARRRAEQQMEIEQAKASVESEVVVRTAQLRASEQAFRQLAEAAPVGIFQTTISGENLFMNSELPRLLDCEPSDLLNGKWVSILDQDCGKQTEELWYTSVNSNREFTMESTVIGKSGKRLFIRTRAVPVFYESGEFCGYVGTVQDISDYKLAEQKLLLENEFNIAFSSSETFADVMTTVMQKVCEISGWELAVFRAKGAADEKDEAVSWHTIGVGQQTLDAVLTRGCKINGVDGKLEPRGDLAGYIAVPIMSGFDRIGTLELASRKISTLDNNAFGHLQSLGRELGQHITRYRAENTIKAREAMLRAIHDSVAEAIVALDEQGHVISSNAAAAKIFSTDRTTLPKRALWELVPNRARANFDCSTWEQISQQLMSGEAIRFEGTGRRLSGELFPVEVALTEAGIQDSRMFVAVVRDISERKESERRVAEFYSIVSHELRTPLTSIRGSLGLISGGLTGDIPEEAMELLDIASESCDRLIRLINDILDLKKLESGKFAFRLEKLYPARVVARALEQIDGLAKGKQVSLESDIACETAFLGDSDRVLQVLTNLISNAIKFSDQGAFVAVKVCLTEDAKYIRFLVTDRGPGIPAEHLGKLFGKFQQIDSSDTRPQEGTGLGLAISKSIVEQLNGTIGVDTEPGRGSTFWFDLPVPDEE
jgi:PAS domain S-box-containing protein